MATIKDDLKQGNQYQRQPKEEPINLEVFNRYWRWLRSMDGKEIIRIEIKERDNEKIS